MSHPKTVEKPTCKLLGTDGNVFAIIGTVSKCLKRAGQPIAAKAFADRAMSCGSYDAVLQLCFEYVELNDMKLPREATAPLNQYRFLVYIWKRLGSPCKRYGAQTIDGAMQLVGSATDWSIRENKGDRFQEVRSS